MILASTRYRDGAFHSGGLRFAVEGDDADMKLARAWDKLEQDYPRFHRADRLSRVLLLGAAPFFAPGGALEKADREHIGMLLCTSTGSMESDHRYHELLRTSGTASPALFVPTLPSIALGELSIRHGLHGSGLCLMMPAPSAAAIAPAIGMLRQQGMRWAVCGWTDTFAGRAEAILAAMDMEHAADDLVNELQHLFDEH